MSFAPRPLNFPKTKEDSSLRTNNKHLVHIQDTPDIRGEFCTININITWDVAEKIVCFAAPVLKALERSVDTRTAKEIKLQNQLMQIAVENRKKRRTVLKHVFNNLKKIHKQQYSYAEFCQSLDSDIGFSHIFDFSNNQRRMIFKRVRAWSIQTMLKNGVSTKQVAKLHNLDVSNVYNYLKFDRKSIKYRSRYQYREQLLTQTKVI